MQTRYVVDKENAAIAALEQGFIVRATVKDTGLPMPILPVQWTAVSASLSDATHDFEIDPAHADDLQVRVSDRAGFNPRTHSSASETPDWYEGNVGAVKNGEPTIDGWKVCCGRHVITERDGKRFPRFAIKN